MHNLTRRVPKLWVGSSIPENYGDCHCACPGISDSGAIQTSCETFARDLNTGKIRDICINQRNFLEQRDEYLIALNVKGKRLVILNKEAGRLFEYLPGNSEDLKRRFPAWLGETFEQITALLLALNVLSSPHTDYSDQTVQDEPDTLVAWLHLTSQCQLACQYCYVTHSEQRMNVATAQRAIAAIYRSAQIHGYARVKLKYAGGEPTLNFEALRVAQQQAEMLSAQTGIELETVLLTNGVQITDEQINTLLTHNIQVAVSLDGLQAYHDSQRPLASRNGSSFTLTARTIDRLIECGIFPHISITLTKQNLKGLPALIEYLLDRQLRFSLNFYREPTPSWEQEILSLQDQELIEGLLSAFQVIEQRVPRYSLLANLADRADMSIRHIRPCAVGQNYLAIACDGKIAPCQMEMQHPITTIDADDPLGFIQKHQHGIQNLPVDQKECKECVWRYWCTGGCPRLTFQRIGRYDAKSPLCEVYQAILPEVVRLEALRLLCYERPWNFFIPS
jgi:uncharacterized protein